MNPDFTCFSQKLSAKLKDIDEKYKETYPEAEAGKLLIARDLGNGKFKVDFSKDFPKDNDAYYLDITKAVELAMKECGLKGSFEYPMP